MVCRSIQSVNLFRRRSPHTIRSGQPVLLDQRACSVACITNSSRPQGKLVRVLSGHIWDVAVDLRRELTRLRQMGRLPSQERSLPTTTSNSSGSPKASPTASSSSPTPPKSYTKPPISITPPENAPSSGTTPPSTSPGPSMLSTASPSVSPKDALGALFTAADLPPSISSRYR